MTIAGLVYIVAGESSGDLLGANLIRALKKQGNLSFAGIGGPDMAAEGCQSLFPMSDLSLMGIVEIIPHIPKIFKRLAQTEQDIVRKQPDIVVTIDSPGFCFRLAKRLRGHGIPLVHYTAPTVWAWRPKRAQKIAQLYDHLLTLFPFEPPYFLKEGLNTTFVGHPLVEMDITPERGLGFRQKHHLDEASLLICLLPGSRRSEVDRLLPTFMDVIRQLKVFYSNFQLVMPVVPHLKEHLSQFLAPHDLPILMVTDTQEKIAAMAASNVALAASGTVALELALAETPTVIAYKANPLTIFIVRRLILTPYVCLTNILLGRRVVPELLQENCTPPKILEALLYEIKGQQKKELKKVRKLITPNGGNPSDIAARKIIELMEKIS
ncbi:MAG: lipid-A-disaccharide synthase [Janthinobacterium lividum]